MGKVRVRVQIKGRVQGVFFRDETRRMARSVEVTGWVKNLANGNVQAVFEGEEDQVKKVLAWCDEGPPLASVKAKEVVWQDYTGEFPSFEVVY